MSKKKDSTQYQTDLFWTACEMVSGVADMVMAIHSKAHPDSFTPEQDKQCEYATNALLNIIAGTTFSTSGTADTRQQAQEEVERVLQKLKGEQQ